MPWKRPFPPYFGRIGCFPHAIYPPQGPGSIYSLLFLIKLCKYCEGILQHCLSNLCHLGDFMKIIDGGFRERRAMALASSPIRSISWLIFIVATSKRNRQPLESEWKDES